MPPEERPKFSARRMKLDYEDVEIAEVISHKEFSKLTGKHDIALIRLKEPLEFNGKHIFIK